MKIRLLFFFSLFPVSLFAQNFDVFISSTNFLWVGIPNSLSFTFCNSSERNMGGYDNMFLVSENATIQNELITPHRRGMHLLTYYGVKGKDTTKVYENVFEAYDLPRATASIYGKSGGAIPIADLPYIKEINAKIYIPRNDITLEIRSYELAIIKNGQVIFTKTFTGYLFPKEALDLFPSLEKGDRIIVSNIITKNLAGEDEPASPVALEVE